MAGETRYAQSGDVSIAYQVIGAGGLDVVLVPGAFTHLASEVLVSSTVKDLVAGSGLHFSERGAHELKGVPGAWRLHSVTSG